MMTMLVTLADKNIILSCLIKVFVFISTNIICYWNEISGWIRCIFPVKSRYSSIKKYKNVYNGKRCFIICTGPSLTIEDVEKIKNEYTFGMNSLCLLKDKTDFRPTFFGCTDAIVYKKFKKEIEEFCDDTVNVIINDRVAKYAQFGKKWNVVPYNVAYHTYDRWFKHKYWCKFSDDCYRIIYDMYSVTHFLIQIATYMGFSEIYLLGADCNFQKNKQTHFIEYGTLDQDFDSAEERCVAGYITVKGYMDTHSVKVFNATRGGKLELFERVDLDKVVGGI